MAINSMLDVFNTIQAHDIVTLETQFPDFYHNDATPIASVNVKSRLVEILQKCAVAQHKACFDFILTFCSDFEKDGAPLLWAAAHNHSITHLLATPIDPKHAQDALGVAIECGQLEHTKQLLPIAGGVIGFLHPLWVAIYHKQIDIFNFLMTTNYLPSSEKPKPWEAGWDDMLIAAATYNFPECTTQLLERGADPKAKKSLALQFAGGHDDQIIFNVLYPLSSLDEALHDMQAKLSNPNMVKTRDIIEKRHAEEQRNVIVQHIDAHESPLQEQRKM